MTYEFDVDDYLMHYGKKGMKWGIRNEKPGGGEKRKRTPEEKKALAKKIAIGTAILIAAVGAAVIGRKLHKDGKLPIKKVAKSSTKKVGDKAVDKFLEEPTSIFHSGNSPHRGFAVIKNGDVQEPYALMERAGLMSTGRGELSSNQMRRLADGTVSAQLVDPKGRKDRAGRDILHGIVVPKTMANDITSIDDVRTKIWPLLEKDYDLWSTASAQAKHVDGNMTYEFDVDDYLMHYGKKGMKWGQRNARLVVGIAQRDKKIKDARGRQKKRLKKLQDADDAYMLATTNKGSAAAEKVMKQAEQAYLHNPDKKTARRMTSGEKVVTGVLLTAGALAVGAILKSPSGGPAPLSPSNMFHPDKWTG